MSRLAAKRKSECDPDSISTYKFGNSESGRQRRPQHVRQGVLSRRDECHSPRRVLLLPLGLPDIIDPTLTGIIMPIQRTFYMVGLASATMEHTNRVIYKVYLNKGVSGVSRMITSWNLLVRNILADEDHTRMSPSVNSIPHARKASNSRNLWTALDQPCRSFKLSNFKIIERHQGNRPIPPYLLDVKALWGLLPNPSFKQKSVLVDLSNLKRTLPEGDSDKIHESLKGFVKSAEREPEFLFKLDKFSLQLKHLYRSTHVRSSHLDLSFRGCFESSRSKGGKTGAFIDKVVNGFLNLPLFDLFPSRPDSNLYDLFGQLVLRPEDWDEDALLSTCLFPDLIINGKLDDRLGHVSLLWAIHTIRIEESASIDIDNEFFMSGTSYDKPSVARFHGGRIRCRVSPQPEEGFKVRVITITSLAVSVIGAIARHLLDHDLKTSREVDIGLFERVKLYTFLEHIGGTQTANPNKMLLNPAPRHAESVDLTTATNTPSRVNVKEVLHGHLNCISHPTESFLRFAVDIAVSERVFELDKGIVGPVPGAHNCGIMMGEGLSGIFLNDSSALIRCSVSRFMDAFPELRGVTHMTTDSARRFASENRDRIQAFLDSVQIAPNRASTQSGDDVVSLSNESQTAAFRILYVVFGFEPSDSTWYSSPHYATFTEETAISTHDSNGWKFVDSVKPRVFSQTGSDPFGKVLVSRMKLLGSYIRNFEPHDLRKDRAIQMAAQMLDEHHAWKRSIDRFDIPVGLPSFLGGIDHPVGLSSNYLMTLSVDNLSVIKGLLSLDAIEAFKYLYDTPEELIGTASADLIDLKVSELIDNLLQIPEVDVYVPDADFMFDLKEILPPQMRWQDTLTSRKRFCKDHNLVTITDAVNLYINRIKLLSLLESEERALPRKAWKVTSSKVKKLHERFPASAFAPRPEEVSELGVWKIREKVVGRASELCVPSSMIDSLLSGLALPSLVLCWSQKTG